MIISYLEYADEAGWAALTALFEELVVAAAKGSGRIGKTLEDLRPMERLMISLLNQNL